MGVSSIAVLSLLRVLTLDEAVHAAEQHQPAIAQAAAQTAAARARADAAYAPLLPSVNGTASYSRLTQNGGIRDVTPSLASHDGFNFSVNGGLLLWDFNQTSGRYDAAKASAAAQADTGRATVDSVVLDARLAFFAARAAKALVTVTEGDLANQQKHLSQIERLVAVGARPAIDLAQARADLANARVAEVRAVNGYALARAQLARAMGVDDAGDFDVSDDTLAPVTGEDGTTEALLDEALHARPELAAAAQALEAQRLGLGATERGWLPSVRLTTGMSASGGAMDDLAPNLSAGVTLSWPIFDGGLTEARTREASAGLQALAAQRDGLRQSVRLDVEQARLGVGGAKATAEAAGDALDNARERLRLAEARYQQGLGGIIELGDAQQAYTSAAAQRVASDFSLAAARAQLLRAVGRAVG